MLVLILYMIPIIKKNIKPPSGYIFPERFDYSIVKFANNIIWILVLELQKDDGTKPLDVNILNENIILGILQYIGLRFQE